MISTEKNESTRAKIVYTSERRSVPFAAFAVSIQSGVI